MNQRNIGDNVTNEKRRKYEPPSKTRKKHERILVRIQHPSGSVSICHLPPSRIYQSAITQLQKHFEMLPIYLVYHGTSVMKYKRSDSTNNTFHIDIFSVRIWERDLMDIENGIDINRQTQEFKVPTFYGRNEHVMRHFVDMMDSEGKAIKLPPNIYGPVLYICKCENKHTNGMMSCDIGKYKYHSFSDYLWRDFDQLRISKYTRIHSPFSILFDMLGLFEDKNNKDDGRDSSSDDEVYVEGNDAKRIRKNPSQQDISFNTLSKPLETQESSNWILFY